MRNWLQAKGEILVILKPSSTLDVQVKPDGDTFAPGDEVAYTITVNDRKTGRLVTDREVVVSVRVTDDSVFSKIENRKQPPSLGAAVYLENEVQKNSFEFYYSNQYIDHWFQSSATADPDSNDRNLELLLGIQGWRTNIFDLNRL